MVTSSDFNIGSSNVSQPKIPPQSEPVDPKELYRRLEQVIKEREARAKRRRPPTLKLDQPTIIPTIISDPVGPLDSAKQSHTPPPPTALPTRPISQIPEFSSHPRPRSLQVPQEITETRPAPRPFYPETYGGEVFGSFGPRNLSELGQAARLGAKTSSRPSTSWHVERQARATSVDEEEEGIGLAISTKPQRPKSMSHMVHDEDVTVIVTDGPGLTKRDSTRRGKVRSQIVQVVNRENSMPIIAPISAMEEQASPYLLPTVAPIETVKLPSEVSPVAAAPHLSPSTEFRAERKSWNPKTFLSKLKDRNASSDKLQTTPSPVERRPSVPPLDDFILEPIPPIHDSHRVSLSTHSNSPVESPQGRQNSTFEPFYFSYQRFSGTSDMSSSRLSYPAQLRNSDIDSGLGMSDTNSNFGMSNISTESILTLIQGAEKRPDCTKLDSPRKRDSRIPSALFYAPPELSSPSRQHFRESGLRNEVEIETSQVEPDPHINLQIEPPEDEGIYVNSPSPHPGPPVPEISTVKAEYHQGGVAMEAPVIQTGPSGKTPTIQKRRSLNPKKLFRRPKSFSATILAATSPEPQTIIPFSDSPPVPIIDPQTTRPSSRSQPILVNYSRTSSSHASINAVSASIAEQQPQQKQSTACQPQEDRWQPSPLPTSNTPMISRPPKVPRHEMEHMTPASITLLRTQEQLLARRSTMHLIGVHAPPRFDDQGGEIGVAMPFTADSGYPSGHSTGRRSAMGAVVRENADEIAMKRRSSHTRGLSTGNFASLRTGTKGFSRDVPAGSVSMIELTKLSTVQPNMESEQVKPSSKKNKKKHWWKVWRLV
jgi:hypothetical protein